MIPWEDPLTLTCQGYHETRKVPKVHASLCRLSRSATMANFRRHLHTKRNNPSQSQCKEKKVRLIFLFSCRKCSEGFLYQGANDGLEANPISFLSLYTVLLKENGIFSYVFLEWYSLSCVKATESIEMEFASMYLAYLNHTRNLASITPVLVPVSIFYTISRWWPLQLCYTRLYFGIADFSHEQNDDKSKIVCSITI